MSDYFESQAEQQALLQRAAQERKRLLEAQTEQTQANQNSKLQGAGTILGAIVGAYFGNPQAGASIGGAIGGGVGQMRKRAHGQQGQGLDLQQLAQQAQKFKFGSGDQGGANTSSLEGMGDYNIPTSEVA